MDAGTFKVYVDGNRYSGNSIIPGATSLVVAPYTCDSHNDGRDLFNNFGQKPFKFPPPAGFQSLNAASVRPETVIARPDQFVSAVLWTGNSTARKIVTNNAPDFVWTKLRNTDNNHNLFDSVRGAEKNLGLLRMVRGNRVWISYCL